MAPEVFFLCYVQDEGVDLCYKRILSQSGVCGICSKFILGWSTSAVAKRRPEQSQRQGRSEVVQYINPRLGFTPLFSCKPPYGVVTQTLDNSEKCCWLAPVVFPIRIGGVFHVKSCVSAVIDLTCFIV